MLLAREKNYGEVRRAEGFIIDITENCVNRLYELDRAEQKNFFIKRCEHWTGLTNCVYKDIYVESLTGSLMAIALTYSKAVDRVICFQGPGFQVWAEQKIKGEVRLYTTGKYYYTRTISLKGYGYDIEAEVMDIVRDILRIDGKEIHNDLYYKNID